MPDHNVPRRTFLKLAGLGAAGAALNKAGVANFGAQYINLKSVHLPYESSPAEIAATRSEVEAAGLHIVGGGMITFETDTDDGVRKYFDYAKAAGMPLIVGTSKPSVLPRIEKFVKQY